MDAGAEQSLSEHSRRLNLLMAGGSHPLKSTVPMPRRSPGRSPQDALAAASQPIRANRVGGDKMRCPCGRIDVVMERFSA